MDAIIFDIDGTLWDSRNQVINSWNRTLERVYGRPFSYTANELSPLFGKVMDEIAEFLFPDKSEDERTKLAEACFDEEVEWLYKDRVSLYPGVKETIEVLSGKYPCYIVSNCQCGYVRVLLETTGLAPYISGSLCFGDTGTRKGMTLKRLCEKHQISNPVYVGDTQGDMEACKEAGIPMIYAAYGLGNVEEPEMSIRHFSELLSIIR